MPKIRGEYTIMNVTIDPELKAWLAKSENSISATVESIIRSAWYRHKRDRRIVQAERRELVSRDWSWNQERDRRIRVKHEAIELVRSLQDKEIKTDRISMLIYELNSFIQEVVRGD